MPHNTQEKMEEWEGGGAQMLLEDPNIIKL